MKKTLSTVPAAVPVPATQPPTAAPDWLTETPDETRYSLDMEDTDSLVVQEVPVTRAEFVALKQHLAGLRGIIPGPAVAEPAAEPQPKLDPMTTGLSELSPEQEQEVRRALLARLQRQFAGMSTCLIQSIAWYADIEEADRGSDTPAEDFITGLVISNHVRSLTPDAAASDLEEFRENFDCMAESTRMFKERYPKAFETATAA